MSRNQKIKQEYHRAENLRKKTENLEISWTKCCTCFLWGVFYVDCFSCSGAFPDILAVNRVGSMGMTLWFPYPYVGNGVTNDELCWLSRLFLSEGISGTIASKVFIMAWPISRKDNHKSMHLWMNLLIDIPTALFMAWYAFKMSMTSSNEDLAFFLFLGFGPILAFLDSLASAAFGMELSEEGTEFDVSSSSPIFNQQSSSVITNQQASIISH